MLRSLIEKATRKTVLRRRLPPESGGASMYVSGSAGLKYVFRSMRRIDPELRSCAKEFVRSGGVVWDVGANVGLFAFSAAHHAGAAGRVIAFEPDAWLVQLLRRSAALQPESSAVVDVVPVAVAESCDIRTFNLAARSRATNFLAGYGSPSAGGIRETQSVVAVSLDWLAERLPVPDVIKIDVEGAELEVLHGARRLLDTRRPILMCEVSPVNAVAVAALLRSCGYLIYDADVAPARRVELSDAPWSTLAMASPRSTPPIAAAPAGQG